MVGHDFDYWDETWRGWYSFDCKSLNSSDEVVSVKVKFKITGEIEEARHPRAQLGFYFLSRDPTDYESREELFNRLNSGVQLRDGLFYQISDVTSFPMTTDFIDLGIIGAKSLERCISQNTWSFSVVDQYEGVNEKDYDEGLKLELAEIQVEYIPGGKIIKVSDLVTISEENADQTSFYLEWNSTFTLQRVNILLYENGKFFQSIKENLDNAGEYTWVVNKESKFNQLAIYTIIIQDSSNSSIMGMSNEYQFPYFPDVLVPDDNMPVYAINIVIIVICITLVVAMILFLPKSLGQRRLKKNIAKSMQYITPQPQKNQQKPKPQDADQGKTQDNKPKENEVGGVLGTTVLCKNCNAEINSNDKICMYCGIDLNR
jgi:hypothetical protein